jgi:hypothetical protein
MRIKQHIITSNKKEHQMQNQIDSQKTIEAVRDRYGSVLEFCRQVDIASPYFYMIVNGRRGRGIQSNRGPTPTRSPLVLQRLRDEELLKYEEVSNG